MRSMSFMMTADAILANTKTVTRRIGWNGLQPNVRLHAVRKAMGLKKGEKQERLAMIQVVSVRKERLDEITAEDVVLEGLHVTPTEFIDRFCKAMRCKPDQIVNRIEFRYVGWYAPDDDQGPKKEVKP